MTHRSLAWFGLLAPPLAWATQLVAGYSIEESACGRPDSSLWGASVHSLTGVVIVACACLAALGGVVSVIGWIGGRGDSRGVARFMAVAGLLGSLIFLLAIVLGAFAVRDLGGCRPG
jgi:hypothetical protein